MGKVIMAGIIPNLTEPEVIPDVGTIWLFTSDGTFTVPATGTYQVEMHGGGGGCAVYVGESTNAEVGTGGGSGEIYTVELTAEQIVLVSIGLGGIGAIGYAYEDIIATDGGTTTFGDLSIAGGGGGKYTMGVYGAYVATGGEASGSIASSGPNTSYAAVSQGLASGGQGNTSNTAQTYGDGGGAYKSSTGEVVAYDGEPGAVIVTFVGVS